VALAPTTWLVIGKRGKVLRLVTAKFAMVRRFLDQLHAVGAITPAGSSPLGLYLIHA